MNSKIDGNWNKIRQELEDVALVWRLYFAVSELE
jgi:hypothetical protein